ncbi:hypothetical protein ABEG63_00865 [Chryseobacterium sp. C39-AII1]|uniref:hypothetical protein n=1 Tax=Chryseobacterium sp. C39-AII1 TaxID=3080332 RepID=UPI00320A5279
MLKAYKPVNYKIKDIHKLIEFLVTEVWCKADRKLPKTRLNAELKSIYENSDYEWFKDSVDKIYILFKDKSFSQADKDNFHRVFINNNEIEKLCNGTNSPIYAKDFNPIIKDAIVEFFSQLYTKFLGWKVIKDNYGTKKGYYDILVSRTNHFKECPCCGYGDLKTWFSESRSAFDHYLPIKHYPLSSINFDNLAPICDECNGRGVKGEKDILFKGRKKAFYPFSKTHSPINVSVDFDTSIISFIVSEINDEKFDKNSFRIGFSISSPEVNSWNKIYKIDSRYKGKLADNKCGWFRKVKKQFELEYLKNKKYSAVDAFEHIIKLDDEDHLSLLKIPYLTKLKSFKSLVKAVEEVSGSSTIKKVRK